MDQRLEDEIHALEERLLDADVRNSRDSLAQLLDDGFLEIGSSGKVFTKEAVIDALVADPGARRTTVLDFRTVQLAPLVVLATYRLIVFTSSDTATHSLRSSVWVHRGGIWRMAFHQGTRCNAAGSLP